MDSHASKLTQVEVVHDFVLMVMHLSLLFILGLFAAIQIALSVLRAGMSDLQASTYTDFNLKEALL